MTVIESEVRQREFRGATFRYGVYTVGDFGNASYYTHEVAELHIRARFWNPAPGDVVADVGAAFGSYTLPAAALGARVFAFEPVPEFVECLERNVQLNDWPPGRVTVVPYALSDANEDLDYPPPGHPDHHRFRFHGRRLDDVADGLGLGRLDWLKSDTEGHESQVLRGAHRTLDSLHPRLLLEVHKFLDQPGAPSQEELIARELASLGYTWEKLVDSPVDYLFATHT